MILKYIKEKLLHYSWDLAFGQYSDDIIKNGLSSSNIKVIKNPYKNKWFADPFILEETESSLVLLVEEFDYKINRGRIAKLTINKRLQIIENCKIILDFPTHLSFPALYRIEGDIWVHPENSQSGASYIYKYDSEHESFVERKLVINKPLADAIIIKSGECYLMYGTEDPNPNNDELHIYQADTFTGPYVEVAIEKLYSNFARMAGGIIQYNGKNIRPAQDCNGAYGRAVLFVNENKVIGKIIPHSIKYAGVHTFNTNGKTYIIDLKRYDFPYLYWLKEKIKKI